MRQKLNIKRQVASQVKKWRMRKQLTQEALAEKSGIHYKYYQKIETGAVNLTLDSLERLAEALAVSPKNFFQ